MALNTELQRKAPLTSWWTHAKTHAALRAALESRIKDGMMRVPTPTFGLAHNTATMIAKRRKKTDAR